MSIMTNKKADFKLKVERAKLQVKKYEPEIRVYSGVGMMAGGTVAAVVATNKTARILDDLDEDKMLIQEIHTDQLVAEKEIKKASLKAGGKVAMAYAPAALLTIGGALNILQGFKVIKGRYASTCAALAVAQQQIEEYRSRVIDQVGEEKEQEIQKTTTDKTKEGTVKPKGSVYQRMFDERSSEYRKGDANYNYAFIASTKAYYNEVLQTRGHVFLNEVYDGLGLDPTPEGQVLGWIRDGKGDGYIDFGLELGGCKDFIEGKVDTVMLDFNVDGVVYDQI